ncbi:sugar ABC transporter substrate-binding protein [Catenuloplanes atrovinosus]|uniref:D-xylose transport system substrate-binding protein n=1 Tax=Catenuloplanes atrovinosus TaxID=137266 RepID=A0AAE4C6B9_9ACTN|nr:substrate-binding domain-containing protein [Catenuloplanes atrovinosus]MDR7273371.1 D-xylose transport system substrate-binding protein [Catenuloplanes atrovinosus]
MKRIQRRVAVAGILTLGLLVAGCGGGDAAETAGDEGYRVGLLLPESKTTRYDTFDRPFIEARLGEACADCEVLYRNADSDARQQAAQAEELLDQDVRVLILDAVDATAAGAVVQGAEARGVPVVAYDRLAAGPVDYYVSFDNEKVGQAQARSLLEALGPSPAGGAIVMINGAPADPNAAGFKRGAHAVLDGAVTIGREFDTPDWSAEAARTGMAAAITALGAEKIIGVYAANDGTAGGAIEALKAAGVTDLPPVTGQDAEIAAVQRILTGEQHSTIYKAIKPQATVAADMAVAAATGTPYAGHATTFTDNGTAKVTSVLLPPVAVTRANVKDTVVADGFYTAPQLCTGSFAAACHDAGIR